MLFDPDMFLKLFVAAAMQFYFFTCFICFFLVALCFLYNY